MGFDAETFVRDGLVAAPQTDPLAALRADVTAYLDANLPGMAYDDALRKLVQTPEVYGILPASLPYEVVAVNGVSFDFRKSSSIKCVSSRRARMARSFSTVSNPFRASSAGV